MDMIMQAQRHGEKSIEVSQEMFNHFTRGLKTPYFIYHNIKVYLRGTRENMELEDNMMCDDLNNKKHKEGRL